MDAETFGGADAATSLAAPLSLTLGNKMITAIQNPAKRFPLEEYYKWEMPANVPIAIPGELDRRIWWFGTNTL